MVNAASRLHLVRYEAEPDWGEDFDREEERVLDDIEVARLLLGASDRVQPEGAAVPVVAIDAVGESDSLAVMRGFFIGLAWTVSAWSLVVAIFLLA